MERKICIISGANSGIGKQAAVQIAAEGYHVIMVCRNRERGEAALNQIRSMNSSYSIELKIVDISLMESIREFAEDFNRTHVKLDVLIHNAAVFNVTQKQRKITDEGVESVWATNHLGPVLLTELLLEKLKQSENGRILTIASKGLKAKPFLKIDLYDPEFEHKKFNVVNAYYQSKLAQIMYTYWMAERLKETDITANNIRVTAVQIDISRHPELSVFLKWVYSQKTKLSLTPVEMARTYTNLAISGRVSKLSGRCFDENSSEVESGKYSINNANIMAVMELTARYISELSGRL
jgi:NAD(P)-dependent dehydrogenase (short-subunit alcohol dehydrogenase family)